MSKQKKKEFDFKIKRKYANEYEREVEHNGKKFKVKDIVISAYCLVDGKQVKLYLNNDDQYHALLEKARYKFNNDKI